MQVKLKNETIVLNTTINAIFHNSGFKSFIDREA